LISSFRREADENCVLLSSCAASSAISLPTFCTYYRSDLQGAKNPRRIRKQPKKILGPWRWDQ